MLNWMILPFRHYAEFTGRSRRMEFWSFALLNLIVYAVLTAITLGTGTSLETLTRMDGADPRTVYSVFFSGSGVLVSLWWLATLLPNLAVTVRRLHDRDMSGWWYLAAIVVGLIPLIGVIAGLALLVVMLLPGTPGPNRFGPDPKNPTGADVFA